MDVHAFASLAHIRVLLVPVGAIVRSSFDAYAAEIRSFESIRLSDIPAETKDGKGARFLPNPLSTGHLHITFTSHPPPRSHATLALVRPSHFPLAVIGIATCARRDVLATIHQQFNTTLADLFPGDTVFPLSKQCLVFEEGELGGGLNVDDSLTGIVVVPSMMGNRKLHIGTLLGVACANILSGFGSLVEALENPLGNEYLNASLMPILPPLSELPSPLTSLIGPPTLPSFSSTPDVSRTSFSLSPAPSIKRNASATSAPARQSTLSVQTQKKRASLIGTSSPDSRLYKMLGDFFLLAGRVEDALVWYTEAILLLKGSYDPLWYACALEGMATTMVVEAWSKNHGLNTSATATKDPWADIADKLTQASASYLRVPAPDNETTHSLLSFLYCRCILRHTSMLFSVWSTKGWGPLAFAAMIQPGPRPFFPPTLAGKDGVDSLSLERLSSLTNISRASIAVTISQLHGPWLLHLGPRERIAILEATASIYGCLGYRRKETYILREVLGCILDLIVCGRDEDGLSQPSTLVTPGLGIQAPANGGTLGIRFSESPDGNASILKLLTHICRVFKIDLEAVSLVDTTDDSQANQDPTLDDYDRDLVDEVREHFGWPELQVGVIREAIAVAEALPDFPAVAQYSLSALKTMQNILSSDDQYHLYATANRALMTSQRRGDIRTVEYWTGRPVISITLAPLPSVRIPIEKLRALVKKTNIGPPLLAGATDPFLYNPRRVQGAGAASLVVEDEILEFVVTLQNPYVFPLELQELSLSTSGVEFESQPQKVIVPPNAMYQVAITGKPLETGLLTVRGCFVQSPGGARREFILPLFTTDEEERLSRRRRALVSETLRFKYTGLTQPPPPQDPGKRSSAQSAKAMEKFKFLQCKVIPKQPLLRIRRSSVAHGALMLYDGERSTIRLTLENISDIPIEFIRLAFEDTTVDFAQKALAEGNLSVFETYETEYSLINNPAFSWDQSEAKPILPHQTLSLTLSCSGKVGCSNGTIHVSYSHDEASGEEGSEVFYLRHVSYPVTVTVYHMLDCSSMDLLPFPSYPNLEMGGGARKNLREIGLEDSVGWCLFAIDVRNTYGLPFDVTLVRTQNREVDASTTTTIPPGAVSRMAIPIRKVRLSQDVMSKPIPMLSDRQFVVAQSGLTKEEEKAQQELFWYREELLKSVQAKWHETGGTRSGTLSFRTERMTLPMLQTFRLEDSQVSMFLDTEEEFTERERSPNGTRYQVQTGTFVFLHTRVINRSSATSVFTMDIELDPGDAVVHDGVLSDIPVGGIGSGESKNVTTGLCFIASGTFEVSARLRCSQEADGASVRAYITAVVAE